MEGRGRRREGNGERRRGWVVLWGEDGTEEGDEFFVGDVGERVMVDDGLRVCIICKCPWLAFNAEDGGHEEYEIAGRRKFWTTLSRGSCWNQNE